MTLTFILIKMAGYVTFSNGDKSAKLMFVPQLSYE